MDIEELLDDPWHGLRRALPDVSYELYCCTLSIQELPLHAWKREACIEQILLLTREVQDCAERARTEASPGCSLGTLQRGHANKSD